MTFFVNVGLFSGFLTPDVETSGVAVAPVAGKTALGSLAAYVTVSGRVVITD